MPFSATPLNGCLQNSLPDISNFLLGFVRPFAASFCLGIMETTHSKDILLPNIAL